VTGGTALGLRARKRQETLRRITDAGVALFVERGFDAVTIDEIAAAAGISRRTFFHYFRSKDDVLLSFQSGMGEQIAERVRAAPEGARPFAAVRDAVVASCAAFPAEHMIALDRVMRASASVQARKQASYVAHEETLHAALVERWPDPARATGLRLLALVAIGSVRLGIDLFQRDQGRRAMADVLDEAFAAVAAEVGDA
jgi:AcrR family transcriptional regulator